MRALSRSLLKLLSSSVLLGLLGGLGGCSEEVYVQVNCETVADPAVVCTAKQTKGKAEVEVCWDFIATCGNGTKVEAERACAKVKDGGTVTHRTEAPKLKNVDKCAGNAAPTAIVTNMTINGKASTAPAAPSPTPAASPAPAEQPAAPAK
jgi:hypothetical protein